MVFGDMDINSRFEIQALVWYDPNRGGAKAA
jgi:hypothetical protein